ncbi:MAG: ABC transporter permease [Gemmatimonadetes bacterium]|nr:ABC transporter permease [Gemmatimonadota bacterium]NIR80575.1 ABC transporter permease [Gemmatimonadota bacterium]NIT89337.1 ABC transporter permease [Gemmatimonadota bacterium]NIU33146.1 ABC transporter permease [Gemmatimonadota bacterium]NIV63498.1 hypothetical protein [Gemmatimonadota bacterium]
MPYTIREALAAFRRAPLLTGLSAAMVGLALFVVGLFSVAAYNLRQALATVEERVEVVAYLRDGTPDADVAEARRFLEGLDAVSDVVHVSKSDALRVARTDLPEIGDLSGDLDVNPFPASLEIRLAQGYRSSETVRSVAEDVAVYPFVEDVRFGRDWVDKLFLLRRIGAVTAMVIGGAFAVVAALIIGTALRIAIFARRDEIYIMRLVGATQGFIRRPFLVEGALTGALGGVLAVALTWLSFAVVNHYLFAVEWIPALWCALGVVAGIVFGVLASGLAVRKHLREV